MKSQYALPITIVVAGALIAGAVFISGKQSTQTPGGQNPNGTLTARAYDPAKDHILGNPNATVKVVEYMDFECPHCKAFNDTMHQIVSFYGLSGNVAWVQRAFPLGIFSKSPTEAQAAECAAAQGGDAAYFSYADKLFAATQSENSLDLAQLPVIAGQVGLDTAKFNSCLAANTYAKKVDDSRAEAIGYGAQGTPYILIMVGTDAVALNGDQPYASMRAAIDAVLQSSGISSPTGTTTAQ